MLAVLYSLLAPQYYLHTIVAVPFVLLFPIAEVLPAERVRLAGMLRTVGLVYMCATPIILFALF